MTHPILCKIEFVCKKKKKCFVFQLVTAVGVIIWTKLDASSVGTFIWYTQFIFITLGIYASRFWTTAIALTLLFLSSQTLTFVVNLQKWLFILCWGYVPTAIKTIINLKYGLLKMFLFFRIPCIIITIMCLTVTPTIPSNTELKNPNFQFGRIHVAVTILVLIFCFVGKYTDNLFNTIYIVNK